jgi:hypothetical protein
MDTFTCQYGRLGFASEVIDHPSTLFEPKREEMMIDDILKLAC